MKIKNLFNQFGLTQIPLIIGLVIMALAIPIATKLSQSNQDNRNLAAGCVSSTCDGATSESNCWSHAGSGCAWISGKCQCNTSTTGVTITGNCDSFTIKGPAGTKVKLSISDCKQEYYPGKTKEQCQADAQQGVGCASRTVEYPLGTHSLSSSVKCGVYQVDASGNGWSCAKKGCKWNSTTCGGTTTTVTPTPPVTTSLKCNAYCSSDAQCSTGYCAIDPIVGAMVCRNRNCPDYADCQCQVGCNQSCSSDAQCSTGYCYTDTITGTKRCRNRSCPDYTACSCPTTITPTKTPTPPTTKLSCNASCSYDAQCSTGHCYTDTITGTMRCRNRSCPDYPACVCSPTTVTPTVPRTTITPTKTPTPPPPKYPVCEDCKCTMSYREPDMSNGGDVKCSYLPIGAGCCSSCDRLVRVTDFTVSNENPAPGETITLKANGVSTHAPLTYRFNYYRQDAIDSLAVAIGYGCANHDGSKLYPVKKMSNQYWTQIGTIVPTQDMVVSSLSIPFKNASSAAWSAHVIITDSAGLVSDNNYDLDSKPNEAHHMYNLPTNPVACSKGGQRSMLVTNNTRKIDFDFDVRPRLLKGVTYKVWGATDGDGVYAMSCYDRYKPVEIEVYKSNVTAENAGDLGKAGSINSRTWTVPTTAEIGSTYVVMVEVGDQASIKNYRVPATTIFDYAAAVIRKTVVIR